MPYVSTFVAMVALETGSVERHERQMTPEQVQILHGKNSLQESLAKSGKVSRQAWYNRRIGWIWLYVQNDFFHEI